MHPIYALILLAEILTLSSAQVTFNRTTFTFTCPSTPQNGTYCTGPSLRSSIIIRCSGTTGIAGNCNDNLVGVPPIGVKGFAQCYQTNPQSGTAACSYNGTVYPDSGRPSFPIPIPVPFPSSPSPNNNSNNSHSHTYHVFLPPLPSSSSATITNADPPYPIPPNSTTTTVFATATAPRATRTTMIITMATGVSGSRSGSRSGVGTSIFTGSAARNWTKAFEGVQMVAVGLVMVMLDLLQV